MGQRAEAETFAEQAIEVLSDQGESEELAMALSNRAQLDMLAWHLDTSLAWGRRAVEMARRLGSIEVLSHALNNVGTVRTVTGDRSGRSDLEESLRLARTHDLHEHAARAYTNLASTAVQQSPMEKAIHGMVPQNYNDADVEQLVQTITDQIMASVG